MPEIGYQKGSLATWTQLGDEQHETNPELQWPKSIERFDEMRSEDAQIGSVLRAVTFPIMSADWMVDPAGARPEVVDLIAADFNLPVQGRPPAAPLRSKGRFSWGDHLRLALLELPFGHSYFEQVYKVEAHQVRLSKLAWRPPRTIESIDVAADGGLVSITQYGRTGKASVTIPVDRLVAYVNDREGGNWLGRSILRTAYKNWLLKDRILRVQALTAERNGLGVPVYTGADAPEGADVDVVMQYRESEKAAGLTMAKAARAGEAAGASIPHGATFEFKGVTGTLPDTDQPIRYHDEQIARAVLAHFLNLGTETGSWALGSTFANFFTDSLNAVAQHIADVTQQHVVEDLVDLNFGETEPAPRIVFKKIGSEAPATAEAMKLLLDSGAIEPDEDLEAFLRQKYRLPIKGAEPRPLPAPRTAVQDQVAAFFGGKTTSKEES